MLSHVNQIFAITVSAKGLLIKYIPLTLTPGQFFLLLTSFDKPPAHNVEKWKKCQNIILKKTSWAKCIEILNKVSQLDTNSALRSSVVFLWCSFGIFAGYIGLRVNRTNPVCYRCLEMQKAVCMRSLDLYYTCVCVYCGWGVYNVIHGNAAGCI